jgi:phosphoglycolate phosphatase
MAIKAVIFDLDGTVCDSAPDLQASANAMLAGLNKKPLPLELVRSFIGNGVPKLIERIMAASDIAFSPQRLATLTQEFKQIYGADPVAETVLYPGVRNVLETLKADSFALGICTNKVHHLTLKVLTGLNIDQYFSAVVGGDSLPTHKPDPAMLFACISELGAKRTVYVGDSEVDAATALAAKQPFVLFTGGYRKSPVHEIPHSALFDEFKDLPPIIKRTIKKEQAAGAG